MDISPKGKRVARDIYLAYRAAPVVGPGAREAWAAMALGGEPLYQGVLDRGIEPVVSRQSYPDANSMFEDIRKGRILIDHDYVHDDHPLLTSEQRLRFMAVHDVLAHLMRLSYSWDDEVRAYRAHAAMLPPEAAPAVFSEIVAHASAIAMSGKRGSPYKGVILASEMRRAHRLFGWENSERRDF